MRTSFSIAAVVVAAAAWGLVWFLSGDISMRLDARAEALSTASAQSAQQENAVELNALASDTSQERAALGELVGTDVVSIANEIEGAGKAAGAQTTIGSASAVSLPNAPAGVNAIEFVVQSTGTYAQVWRAAQLFQALPLPSSVGSLDFERVPNQSGQGGNWQLTTDIEVLTTATISS